MTPFTRRRFLQTLPAFAGAATLLPGQEPPALPFGADYPMLDSQTTGKWWVKAADAGKAKGKAKGVRGQIIELNVPRNEVVAFAVYTHDAGVLKLSAQLFPLMPDEARLVRLEFKEGGEWKEAGKSEVIYPGWSAHFRLEGWDGTQDVPYRVRHGAEAMFEGLIRHDPVEKDEVVIANMSCNSSRTKGQRPEIIEHLKKQNPDVLFFAGDQTYHHTEHTAGWLEFGLQFREIMKDRPTICIPDDHDVGHPNLWGENGKKSERKDGADGGYFFPPEYVNLVQRAQSWHLPDPVDPEPILQGIGVYFTRLRVGGVDFAILEDRKFKSGPFGKIPEMGPRPDHINDESYDPATVDLPGLELLGQRQMKFLGDWVEDWQGAETKCVLSQTAFCGAVHLHGSPDNRLLADLDCNGWPQTGRDEALRALRRAGATHLCGDQHLAVVTKHGIEAFGDGPYSFTSPALVNTIYGRWWHPKDEQPGPNPVEGSPLPWTGDFKDGLGNRISMMAYANPEDIQDEQKRADGYGVARFVKSSGQVTFECWPRFDDQNQFPGWPITVESAANDGREVAATLPKITVTGAAKPVVLVMDEASGEVLYSRRMTGPEIEPPVFDAGGSYTVKVGKDRPGGKTFEGVKVGGEVLAADV